MEPLYRFLSALLAAHAPWPIVAVVVLALAMSYIGPIHLNLSIGDRSRSKKRGYE